MHRLRAKKATLTSNGHNFLKNGRKTFFLSSFQREGIVLFDDRIVKNDKCLCEPALADKASRAMPLRTHF